MSWQTPITDKAEGSYCLPSDLNRINGNINYLLGVSTKTDYTSNDFLTLTEWQSVINNTIDACNKYGVRITQNPNTEMTADNFNNVETLLLLCYQTLALWQKQATSNVYVQSQYGRYIGVPSNNYIRGFNL